MSDTGNHRRLISSKTSTVTVKRLACDCGACDGLTVQIPKGPFAGGLAFEVIQALAGQIPLLDGDQVEVTAVVRRR